MFIKYHQNSKAVLAAIKPLKVYYRNEILSAKMNPQLCLFKYEVFMIEVIFSLDFAEREGNSFCRNDLDQDFSIQKLFGFCLRETLSIKQTPCLEIRYPGSP